MAAALTPLFGSARKLPSGRWQARYWGPDGRHHTGRTDDGRSLTFSTKRKAVEWLNRTHSDIQSGRWEAPGTRGAPITLKAYAAAWLAERDLAATTRDHYAQMLRDHILPAFGETPVPAITAAAVRTWYADLAKSTGPTSRAHAYGLLRTVLTTAVADELIAANPCRVRGGGSARTVHRTEPATAEQLAVIVAHTPERYRVMVQLAVWCSLRFGELAELRRGDVDVKHGVLRVRRGVTRTSAGVVIKGPKSEAGVRDVPIPSHVLEDVKAHLADHAQPGRDGLLFPARHGGHLAPSSAYRWYYPAREAAGRPDLSFHDLRHTGQTYAAAVGANLRELMARAGQSTPGAALRYLHEVDGRQREIADALSAFATAGNVTPIGGKRKERKNKRAGSA